MKVLSYRVFLEQPLLATQILGDPNSSVSFDYIPGSQIRGMLIHRYLEQRNLTEAEVAHDPDGRRLIFTPEQRNLTEAEVAHDPHCRRLFFNSETRFLHAYPLADGETRTLPTPRALLKRKGASDDDATVYNAAHEDFDREDAEGDDTLKPLGPPFCIAATATLSLHQPAPNTVAVHVLRERTKGRATEAKGAVFQYDALAAGQWFGGVILGNDAVDVATLDKLLAGPAWMGRSRSAGYGKVRIERGTSGNDHWREIGGAYPALAAGVSATLTLLSDTILRDPAGQATLVLDAATLSAYLGVQVTLDDRHSFSAIVPHGGFNRTSRLPLAQSYALTAGSTMVFTPVQTLDTNAVRRLEQQGLGERRAEGFGRIAFNWLTEMELRSTKGAAYTASDNTPSLTTVGHATASAMAHRLLQHAIDQQIAIFVQDQVKDKPELAKNMPANSQLGRVRVLLRRAMPTGNMALVRAGLTDMRAAGKGQFERTRIANTSLWEWLNGLLAGTDDVWQRIELPESQWPTVAGIHATRDPALTQTVTLRLINETLAAAARVRKRGE